jgi:protease-4
MFSRRHPFLFFILVFSAIVASAVVLTSLIGLLSKEKADLRFGEKVGVIEIEGVLTDARPVVERIRHFREQKAIKAIVLRVDSPGGGVGPSQEIHREIRKTMEEKKVVVSMGAVAASGGYYVAAAADGIMANPGTLTGSIGVIMGYTNFEELLDKIGVRPVVVKSGKYKDIASPVGGLSEEERKILQNFTDTVHRQFIAAVAEGRSQSPEEIRRIADGRVFSGETARGLGLVDRLGNFQDAIEWAGRMAGIEGEVRAVYPPEESPSLITYFIDKLASEVGSRIGRAGSSVPAYLYVPEG